MTRELTHRTESGGFRVDVIDDMTIEWDVPIPIDDGNTLRADVFKPSAAGTYPVILSCGPYAKGLQFQQLLPPAWEMMIAEHPEILQGSSGQYNTFEVVDPEKWVPDGFVCVRVDSRGTGRSPGYLDPYSERETRDLYECIEWAAAQPWSNGRIGLSGISYLGINQWQVAALQPPHLAAICVWEGAGDLYRDAVYHGGILSTFPDRWYSLIGQYGDPDKSLRNVHTGQPVFGDETLSSDELSERKLDFSRLVREHPLLDDFYRARIHPDWSRVRVPLVSGGNWGGMGLHLRGSTRGFERARSAQKWLTMHEGSHFSLYYADYGVDLQKRFFGHFLKGQDTGWTEQPPVELRTRNAAGGIGLRTSPTWPLSDTVWTRFYLDACHGSLDPRPPANASARGYRAGRDSLSFRFITTEDIEIVGPVAAKLCIESSTSDADLFLIIRAFTPNGEEIVFQGANDPHVPIAQGWLRASHRVLDEEQSRPFLPVHRHDRAVPLTPGTIYELEVEILPTSIRLPVGYTLALDVQGHDYAYANADGSPHLRGASSFQHNDPAARPPDVYGGTVTLHSGGPHSSYLLLPVIPARD